MERLGGEERRLMHLVPAPGLIPNLCGSAGCLSGKERKQKMKGKDIQERLILPLLSFHFLEAVNQRLMLMLDANYKS